MERKTYKQAQAYGMRLIFVERKNYDEVSEAVRKKYGVEWEDVAYMTDEEVSGKKIPPEAFDKPKRRKVKRL